MELWIALAIGLLAGMVSGLLGVGGGIILTPFLHYVVGRPWADAVALSLFVIAIQSPLGVWRHARKGAVDWRLASPLAIFGALGVWLGDRLLPLLPVSGLKLLFALLLGFAAWRLVSGPVTRGHVPRPLAAAVGFGAGLVSRVLGVGGGVLTVPALSLLGVRAHVAIGTSLVAVFTNAALATGANLARGLAWVEGLGLAAGALGGSLLGVRMAHSLPELNLRRVVASALVLVGLLVAAEALRYLL